MLRVHQMERRLNMKKKLSFLLAIVMVLSLTTTALATEVPISSIESMRTYLTEVGVEEEFINTVSDEMITSPVSYTHLTLPTNSLV